MTDIDKDKEIQHLIDLLSVEKDPIKRYRLEKQLLLWKDAIQVHQLVSLPRVKNVVEKDLLKIAKRAADGLGLPKRKRFKAVRDVVNNVWWYLYSNTVFLLVKMKLMKFSTFEYICFNRKLD